MKFVYFKYGDMLRSETADKYGIVNEPFSEDIVNNINYTLTQLDIIREKFKHPILITSGFRCPELNKLVNGSETSAHKIGYAADIISLKTPNSTLFNHIVKMIKSNEIQIDQLIWEKGNKQNPQWIHISFDKTKLRNQIIHI